MAIVFSALGALRPDATPLERVALAVLGAGGVALLLGVVVLPVLWVSAPTRRGQATDYALRIDHLEVHMPGATAAEDDAAVEERAATTPGAIVGESVYLPDLVRGVRPPLVADRVFKDCEILGPAVVVIDGCTAVRMTLQGSPETTFWTLPGDRPRKVGAIKLQNCTFVDCRLRGLGIAGPAGEIENMQRALETERPPADDLAALFAGSTAI
jgi:hypothetical protein